MEFKGTKGKWESEDFSKEDFIIKSTDENNMRTDVCSVHKYSSHDTDFEALANAKLIACAPELLEMLKNILQAVENSNIESDVISIEELEQLIKRATE
jgi:hypothetical protein